MAELISDIYLGFISATETKINQGIKVKESWCLFTKLSQTCSMKALKTRTYILHK
jgi:hypothetical protein